MQYRVFAHHCVRFRRRYRGTASLPEAALFAGPSWRICVRMLACVCTLVRATCVCDCVSLSCGCAHNCVCCVRAVWSCVRLCAGQVMLAEVSAQHTVPLVNFTEVQNRLATNTEVRGCVPRWFLIADLINPSNADLNTTVVILVIDSALEAQAGLGSGWDKPALGPTEAYVVRVCMCWLCVWLCACASVRECVGVHGFGLCPHWRLSFPPPSRIVP